MMKKLVFGSCLAFALFYGDCWGMEGYVESLDSTSSSSLTFQNRTQEAVSRWSHLVPNGEVKVKIDGLVPQVLGSREKIEQLVTLICSPSNSSKYANYAHMVFVRAFPDSSNKELSKLGGMLASIACDRSGGGGTQKDLYLQEYDSGWYDPCLSCDDESSQ